MQAVSTSFSAHQGLCTSHPSQHTHAVLYTVYLKYVMFASQVNKIEVCASFIEFLILHLRTLVFTQAAFSLLGFKVLHSVQVVELSVYSCLPYVSLSGFSSEPMWIVRGSTQMPAVRIM